MKHLRALALILFLLTLALPAFAQDGDAERAIEYVSKLPEFSSWLSGYPNWFGNASDDEGDGVWYVEFYAEDWAEWLGYANLVLETGEILDSFIPLPLTPEEFQRGQARIVPLILDDPAVAAMLLDPILWDMWIEFNRWDRVWEVYFSRGSQSILVVSTLNEEENYFNIDDIRDPNALEEEELREQLRDEAINLAYGAVNSELDGYDDWTTYTENVRPGVWTVSFVAGGVELFSAVIDVEADEVLETFSP
ncbi:MAG: hypothetical protein IAE80_21575 [Anaerolinea sp.]|nr:hypothetical protein [Anaerolinea sp.]